MKMAFSILLYVSCVVGLDYAAIVAAMSCARVQDRNGKEGILTRSDFMDFMGRMLTCHDIWSLEADGCGTFQMFLVSHKELNECAGM